MDVLVERCCGLDIHKASVVACLLVSPPHGEPVRAVRTFGTMTEDLLALADWLAGAGCTHVAMESTGVYWKPVWNLLEGEFALLLANPRHLKAVPGRKTDVTDAEWIADLLRHGLLQGRFAPDRPQRELRELTRYRASLVRERTAEANRLQKTLEGANLKLASVATDILGKSGREILQALVAGTEDAVALADLAQGRLREKLPELERALAGRVEDHQRFMLAQQLAHVDFLDAAIARVSGEVAARLEPVAEAVARLDTIPGIGRSVAEALIAAIGTGCPLGVAPLPGRRPPGELGGDVPRQPRERRVPPGRCGGAARRARAAPGCGRCWSRPPTPGRGPRGPPCKPRSRRLAARRGKSRAAVAVGHTILVVAYHLLSEGTTYRDLGPTYFDERDRRHVEHRLVRRLEGLGYQVKLTPLAAD
jgi:transposase